jgi:hypothetical protein
MDHIIAGVIICRNGIFLNAFMKIKTLILLGFLGSFRRHIMINVLHIGDTEDFYGPKSPPYHLFIPTSLT